MLNVKMLILRLAQDKSGLMLNVKMLIHAPRSVDVREISVTPPWDVRYINGRCMKDDGWALLSKSGFSYRAILSFGLSRLIDWLMPFDRLARAKKRRVDEGGRAWGHLPLIFLTTNRSNLHESLIDQNRQNILYWAWCSYHSIQHHQVNSQFWRIAC